MRQCVKEDTRVRGACDGVGEACVGGRRDQLSARISAWCSEETGEELIHDSLNNGPF